MEFWMLFILNGWKVIIMLEEFKEVGIDLLEILVWIIDFMKGEQFEDDFIVCNFNQKIFVLKDGD